MKPQIGAALIMTLIVGACVASPAPSTQPTPAPPTTSVPVSTTPATTLAPTTPPTSEPAAARARPATPLATDRTEVPVVDDLIAEVFYPVDEGDYPTVVFFHGGSWYGGDSTTTSEFARTVAGQGAIVYNATYLNGQSGGGYPHSYQDVYCALSTAAVTSPGFGGSPEVIVVGHSAGAHLGATVAMSGEAFASGRCLDRVTPTVAGLAGLAGPYDTFELGAFMAPWFGGAPADVPEAWELGNPQSYVDTPLFPVTLIHGSGDRLVPLDSSRIFADLLAGTGWVAEVYVIPAATHNGVLDPIGDGREVAAKIAEFARSLQQPE